MGIFTNAVAIVLGGMFGCRLFKNSNKNFNILGIGIIIVSLVGFFENVYNIKDGKVVSENLTIVLFSYLFGSKIGECIGMEEKLSNASKTKNNYLNAVIDATLFFGVGGLQISGPILLALNKDNSQLFLKSFIDFVFAIAFGNAYGKVVAFSAFPVAFIQILIFIIAQYFSAFLSSEMVSQLCAMGYIILFFSGFNLIAEGKYKINNINMLPGMLLVILFNILLSLARGII